MKKSLLSLSLATFMMANDSFDQSQYVPDISLTVDTSYVYRDKKTTGEEHAHEHEDHAHAAFNANDGFNLNYAELVLSSNVDPYFSLDGVFHFTEEGVEIEEAYFTTTALEYSLRLRGGKMLSNFGRLNTEHHHVWDFADNSLVNEAFLGNEGLSDMGLQLQWVAPTETYLMGGIEVLQGSEHASFKNSAIEDANISATTAPSLYIGYIKTSFDVGDSIFYGGLSYAYGANNLEHFREDEALSFSGYSTLYGIDLTIKHYFDSYSYLSLQSEWILKNLNGESLENRQKKSVDENEAGYYAQLVYAYNQNYRFGFRGDSLYDEANTQNRYSLMSEYNPSEFARLRLQYNYKDSELDNEGHEQNQHSVILQLNIAIGAHSAHAF